jgi:S-(hydroxymethyl)glutathione dehydrogenase / alcohol dehydrogenase
VIALAECRHALAGFLDDAGPLVAEHDRERIRSRAGDDVPVRVTHSARREPDAHLARPGRCEVQFLDCEGLVHCPEDGGSHRAIVRRMSCRLVAVKTRAAVLWQPGEPVEILEIDLASPKEQEILVRIVACGVCASDLHVVDGDLPEPLPLVLGHEASGVVVETGPGVEQLEAGDHVVLAMLPSCGVCRPCREGRRNSCRLAGQMSKTGTLADGTTRLSLNGTELHHFSGVSSFAEHAVVPVSTAVRIRRDVALEVAALCGCAVITGYGAVVRTAQVEPEASVAVWGCGGIGLNVIQGARIAGAGTIVAVDTRAEKLELARRLGATETVQAGPDVNTAKAVRDLTGGGADYAFEAIGLEPTIQAAWQAVRPGGTVVVVGLMPKGSTLTIDPWGFIIEKTIKGCFLGSAQIDVDIPRLLDYYADGILKLDELVSRRLTLDDLPDAFDRLREGDVRRQLVVFDSQ